MHKAFMIVELVVVVVMLALLAAVAIPGFQRAQANAQIASVQNSQKAVVTALEAYQADYLRFPYHWPRTTAAVGPNPPGLVQNYNYAVAGPPSVFTDVPSFAAAAPGTGQIGLTSPVAYLSSYPIDDFHSAQGETFAYATGPFDFLVWSPGPDDVHDLDGSYGGTQANNNAAEYIVASHIPLPSDYLIAGPAGVTTGMPVLGPASGMSFSFDPTNGTSSVGDIWASRHAQSLPDSSRVENFSQY